jgi:hypothetical protein
MKMTKKTLRGMGAFVLGGALAVTLMSQSALADNLDPLHGFCSGSGQCVDNGTNSPTTNNPVTFGFNISPGPQTGTEVLVFLVADNFSPPSGIAVTGTGAGTATLFNPTPWTSGALDTYFNIPGGASPANPIGAYLPSEQTLNPTATGFFAYTLLLNTQTLPANPGTGGPSDTVMVPLGTYILGFLNVGNATSGPDWIATANSGAIFVSNTLAPPVPEPSSLLLLCTGLVGAAVGVRRRFSR